MDIYKLPIETDKTLKDKTKALIFENKIVCHPDLLEKIKEGMALMKASAEGYETDIVEMSKGKPK